DVASGDAIIEKTNLFVDRLQADRGLAVLAFTLQKPARLRFRVYSLGTVCLNVSTVREVVPISSVGYCPILKPDQKPDNPLFERYFTRLRSIYENGVRLNVNNDQITASYDGVSFNVCSADVFQLVNGLFFGSMY